MTKTISMLTLSLSLTLGAATARAEAPARRGEVVVDGPATKAVVVGPMAIRAYSEFSGGALYTVAARTGTDVDCQVDGARSTATDLRADAVITFSVPAGRVACLTTTRQLEVLWRAGKDAVPAPVESNLPGTMLARR